MQITITAHERAAGPTGFPSVDYDIETPHLIESGADANLAIAILESVGMTPNQARRALHDARDAGTISGDLDHLGVFR